MVQPHSLQLTNEVLKERQQLESTIISLLPLINEGLAKFEELQKEQQILKAHESDILSNKDFQYTTVTFIKSRGRLIYHQGNMWPTALVVI